MSADRPNPASNTALRRVFDDLRRVTRTYDYEKALAELMADSINEKDRVHDDIIAVPHAG
jgi:hypothetical protein